MALLRAQLRPSAGQAMRSDPAGLVPVDCRVISPPSKRWQRFGPGSGVRTSQPGKVPRTTPRRIIEGECSIQERRQDSLRPTVAEADPPCDQAPKKNVTKEEVTVFDGAVGRTAENAVLVGCDPLSLSAATSLGHTAALLSQTTRQLRVAIDVVRSRASDMVQVYEALITLRASAEACNADAQYHLAFCYELGVGVEANATTAFSWYRRAAENGLPDAQYAVGFAYENARGVAQDEKQALFWYGKAARVGCQEAAVAVTRIRRLLLR